MLVVNIIDDAEKLGMSINALKLESELGIPVVLTAGAVGRGVDELKKRIGEYAC
jgi:ferrous iron transport protein B